MTSLSSSLVTLSHWAMSGRARLSGMLSVSRMPTPSRNRRARGVSCSVAASPLASAVFRLRSARFRVFPPFSAPFRSRSAARRTSFRASCSRHIVKITAPVAPASTIFCSMSKSIFIFVSRVPSKIPDNELFDPVTGHRTAIPPKREPFLCPGSLTIERQPSLRTTIWRRADCLSACLRDCAVPSIAPAPFGPGLQCDRIPLVCIHPRAASV